MTWTTTSTQWDTRVSRIQAPIYGGQRLEHHVTVCEAAGVLGVKTQRVRYMIRTGKISGIKIADMWFIPSDAV